MQRLLLTSLTLCLAVIFLGACSSTKSAGSTSTAKTKAKKGAYSPLGSWAYTVSGTPEGDRSGVMVLSQEGDTYSAKLVLDGNEAPLKNVKVVDNKLTAILDYQGYDLDVIGTFEGDNFKGSVGLGYDTFPMTATRKE